MILSGADDKDDENLIIKIGFRLEKVKETKIFRTYLNLAEVMANVGGILKAFLVFFVIVS